MDDVDRKLLRFLQRDGRITNVDLSQRANLSPAATHERIRRLRQDGVIEGYTVRLNPAKLGRALLVFIQVTLDRTTTAAFDDFAAAVRRTLLAKSALRRRARRSARCGLVRAGVRRTMRPSGRG